MKSLIVLRGTSGQGKTSTLNLLRQHLEDDPNYRIVESEPHSNGYDWMSIVDGPWGKVGIITFGDPGTEDHVGGVLNKMLNEGVGIIFVASRTRGGVWDTLHSFAKANSFEIIYTSPLHYEGGSDRVLIKTLNLVQVNMLGSMIERLSSLKKH